jgi:hypothetical protein
MCALKSEQKVLKSVKCEDILEEFHGGVNFV